MCIFTDTGGNVGNLKFINNHIDIASKAQAIKKIS